MGYSTIADTAALNGIRTLALTSSTAYISLLSSTGTEVTSRVASVCAAAAAGSMTGAKVTINVPAGASVASWAAYDAATNGNKIYDGPLPAPETYGSAGTYDLTPTFTASG